MKKNIRNLILAGWLITEAASHASVFSQDFGSDSSGTEWKIQSGDLPFGGITWSNEPGSAGLTFSVPSRFEALSPWEAGVDPFDFWFEMEITRGMSAPWRYNGFVVALASSPPSQMSKDDVCFSLGVFQAGIRAAVATGPFDGKRRKFQQVCVTERNEINLGGAGGSSHSLAWPGKDFSGDRLKGRIQRLSAEKLRFEIYHCAGQFTKPVWVGETELPLRLRGVPVRHVAVFSTQERPDTGKSPEKNEIIEGRLTLLQGWTSPQQPPLIVSVDAPAGVLEKDVELVVLGTGFEKGAEVRIGGVVCETLEEDASRIKVRLRGALEAGPHPLIVRLPNRLLARTTVVAGRYLTAVEPREALPAGGDLVTVRGGGFGPDVQVSIGGKQAGIVKRVGFQELVVKVPAGAVGPAEVKAVGAGSVFSGSPSFGYAPHPHLLFAGSEGLDRERKKFNDPRFADYRKMIELATRDSQERLKDPKAWMQGECREALFGATYLFAMTGDPAHEKAAHDFVDIILDGAEGFFPSKVPGAPGELRQLIGRDEFNIQIGWMLAIYYDVLFDRIPAPKKVKLERVLDAWVVDYTGRVRAKDWWYAGNPSNTIAVGNGAGGSMAAALLHSTPEYRNVVETAAATIDRVFKAISEDGGCVEGNMYWNYGLGAQLSFGLIVQNTLGKDLGMLSQPVFEKLVRFVGTQLGGDGNMFTFNDTQPWLNGSIPAAFCGTRYDQALMRWTADEIARRGARGGQEPEVVRPSYSIFSFLFRDERPVLAEVPALPTAAYLEVLNWGVLRSSSDALGKGLVLGIKGVGGSQTHHANEDAGSFVLQAAGESFLIDPGYFQATASQHNLPLVGDVPPTVFEEKTLDSGKKKWVTTSKVGDVMDKRVAAPISAVWESGGVRTMTVDSTQSYLPKHMRVKSLRRVFAMSGDKAVVILDQIEPVQAGDRVVHYFQAGFPTNIMEKSRSFRILGRHSDLEVLLDGPEGKWSSEPMPWSTNWLFARSGVKWNRVSLASKSDADKPPITVLLPTKQQAPAPQVDVVRNTGLIRVSIPGAEAIVYELVEGRWRLQRRQED